MSSVPLDYFDAEAGTATIALSRYRASRFPRKGIVIFNPGGPGGSGKALVAKAGWLLQALVGEEYDVIGFDPRGIGDSQPKTRCFIGDVDYATFARNTILSRSFDVASNLSIDRARQALVKQQIEVDALYQTQLEVCAEIMGEKLRYAGTSTVVRDIDYITTELEGSDALINFYGFSYGTIMGQYLVNMFPERVGKVVLDGVADTPSWASKPHYLQYRQWLSSATDAYNLFLTQCSEVGPELCPLARRSGESPALIEDRLESFIDGLFYKPMPVPKAKSPGVLTSGHIRVFLMWSIMSPLTWQQAALSLAHAMAGNGAAILDADTVQPRPGVDLERQAVTCNDNAPFAPPPAEAVVDELLDVFHTVSRMAFSIVTTEPDAGCQFWPVTPPERFVGPWNHTLRNPILVISNIADPVTPIASGRLVTELLGNSSRLLVQNSPGHPSVALPSQCTNNVTRQFFADGMLPREGTVCEPDYQPFSDVQASAAWTPEEARRAEAQVLLGQILHFAERNMPFDHLLV